MNSASSAAIDRDGELVNGTRLFDQDGQAIKLGDPYCDGYGTQTQTPSDEAKYPHCGASRAPFTLEEQPSPKPSKK